jgi:hypothetical protein
LGTRRSETRRVTSFKSFSWAMLPQ